MPRLNRDAPDPAGAHLIAPPPTNERVRSVDDFLRILTGWQAQRRRSGEGYLQQLWYRGVNQYFSVLVPGVYRSDFTKRARAHDGKLSAEDARLKLERSMLAEFRIAGAVFLQDSTLVQIYFTAQHFGMPTRLLDWSTNPLAALFFACLGEPGKDGVVHAMDARQVIPMAARRTDRQRLYQSVMSMRHPFVEYAIALSFWEPLREDQPHILPVRPDPMPGRIGQQGSCFTLHMHLAKPVCNESMISIPVEASRKQQLIDDLHLLNVNEFTIFNDLDHLSREIRRSWGLRL